MILFGNLVSLAGCILMVAIGFVRKKERILTLQCFQFGLLGLSNLILGATSGFISGLVSIARNLICPRVKGGLWLKLLFINLQVLLTILVGVDGPVSLLPLIAGVLFIMKGRKPFLHAFLVDDRSSSGILQGIL